MGPRATSVILCGGRGSRMVDGTRAQGAKQMLPLPGGSVIGRLMRQLVSAGIQDHVIVVPRDSSLVAHIGSMSFAGRTRFIETISQKAGDLLLAISAARVAYDLIVIVMGDCVYHDEEIDRFLHSSFPADVDLLVGANPPHPGASDVYVLGDVEGFSRETMSSYVSSGIYLLRSTAATVLLRESASGEPSMSRLLDAAVRGSLGARRFGFSAAYDLNTPEDYEYCLKALSG